MTVDRGRPERSADGIGSPDAGPHGAIRNRSGDRLRFLESAAAGLSLLAPVAYWILRPPPASTSSGNLLFGLLLFAWSFVSIAARSGGRAALVRSSTAFGWGFLCEFVGTRGLAGFAPYTYAGTLGPSLARVPLAVLLFWPGLILILGRIGRSSARSVPLTLSASALAALALFLPFDLAGVARTLWSYSPRGDFHGIFLVGLLGWMAIPVGFLALRAIAGDPEDPCRATDLAIFGGLLLHEIALVGSELSPRLAFGVAAASGTMLLPVALAIARRRSAR